MLFYVDDILIVCKNMDKINELKQRLKSAFEIKDLRAAKKIFGVDLIKDRRKGMLRLSQHNYIKKVLEMFEMETLKPIQTPLLAHFKLSCQQCRRTKNEKG